MAQKDYGIGDVSKIVNISMNTLRFWEKQGYIPTSARLQMGKYSFRRYSESDLESIKQFKQYVDEGLTLKAAAARLTKIMGGK